MAEHLLCRRWRRWGCLCAALFLPTDIHRCYPQRQCTSKALLAWVWAYRSCIYCPACPRVKGKACTYKKPSIINCLDISLRWASWHFQGYWLPRGEKPSSSCTSFLLARDFGCSSRVSKAVLVDTGVPEGIFLSCNVFVFVSGLLATLC